MLKIFVPALVILLLFASCKSGREEVTSKGMKYTVIEEGDGRQPKVGEYVIFDFTITDDHDSLLRSTYKDGLPAFNFVQDTAMIGYHGAIPELLSKARSGDSLRVALNMTDFYKHVAGAPMPAGADTMSLTYNIKIQDVKTAQEFERYRYDKVKTRDDVLIQNYLKEKNITTQQDTSGLHFVIHNQTGKAKPKVEDCIEIKYEGRFLQNGRVFDSGTITMPLSQMIYGWQIGIPKLSEGDSATLFIPSRLGYGSRAQGRIPPDAVLVFDVSLIHVKEFDQQANQCK
jgi:FKBP-type peptidyl-prolyl cis-trans isomerase FkpA